MSAKSKKESKTNFEEIWQQNPMKRPFLEKIVLNIGVGEGGEALESAATILEQISGRKAIKTISKVNVKEFNLRKGRPIGTKVTIRGKDAEKLLKRLLIVNNNKLLLRGFDNFGNFSFGIKEHITIPGIEYDNLLGIWGLNVCGRVVRPGMRVKNRRVRRSNIPRDHYVSRLETQEFLKKNFNVEIVKQLDIEYI